MIREYKKEKILKYLSEATYPVDIEKIRKTCGIGNWNTALNYCLTLLIERKIKGQKTSKSWVFWTHQETHLHPWEEAIGHLEALQVNEDEVTLTLTRTYRELKITFPRNSPEAQTITQTLANTPKGTKIALLKTDDPQKPLLLRILNATTVANKEKSRLLWLRKSILCVAFKGLQLIALKFALSPFELRLWGVFNA